MKRVSKFNAACNPNVSVVILTKNSESTIEKCLRSVIEQNPDEIIAIDTLSTDKTLQILEGFKIKILLDSSNSLGSLRQVGVQTAGRSFVMFVDSDVELGPGCIAQLRSDLAANKWAGAHAMILSASNVSYWQKSEDTAFSLFFNHAGPKTQISTSAVLFRKHVLLKFPFDPQFVESCEDVDLCYRLTESGYKLGVSSAVAYHSHRREFSAFAKQRLNYGIGDARFWLKYRHPSIIFKPLKNAAYNFCYSLITGRAQLIPYWLASGVVEFLGIIIGLTRTLKISLNVKDDLHRTDLIS